MPLRLGTSGNYHDNSRGAQKPYPPSAHHHAPWLSLFALSYTAVLCPPHLKTVTRNKVSNLSGDEACRRLLALRSAAKAAPPTTTTTTTPATAAPGTSGITTATAAVAGAAAAVTATTAGASGGKKTTGAVVDPVAAAAAAVPGVPLPGGKIATRRQLVTARHLVGHVVVMGFPARCGVGWLVVCPLGVLGLRGYIYIFSFENIGAELHP